MFVVLLCATDMERADAAIDPPTAATDPRPFCTALESEPRKLLEGLVYGALALGATAGLLGPACLADSSASVIRSSSEEVEAVVARRCGEHHIGPFVLHGE